MSKQTSYKHIAIGLGYPVDNQTSFTLWTRNSEGVGG